MPSPPTACHSRERTSPNACEARGEGLGSTQKPGNPYGTSCCELLSACPKEVSNPPNRHSSKTAGCDPKNDTSACEVHAEGHFRYPHSTTKMLLSRHLHRE